MKLVVRTLLLPLTLIYPFFVYWTMQNDAHASGIILLISLLVMRLYTAQARHERQLVFGLVLIVFGVILATGSSYGLKLYPVVINLSFLVVFGFSLLSSMPIVERIARLHEPGLPSQATPYLRRVTQVWCLFFAINGSVSLATVVLNNNTWWLWYNGIIAYLLMAIVFIGEWFIRQRVKVQYL